MRVINKKVNPSFVSLKCCKPGDVIQFTAEQHKPYPPDDVYLVLYMRYEENDTVRIANLSSGLISIGNPDRRVTLMNVEANVIGPR